MISNEDGVIETPNIVQVQSVPEIDAESDDDSGGEDTEDEISYFLVSYNNK